MKPHVHAKLIKQWADGAKIQRFEGGIWIDVPGTPSWLLESEYRVKPDISEDFVRYVKKVHSNTYGTYADIRSMLALEEALKKYNITPKEQS